MFLFRPLNDLNLAFPCVNLGPEVRLHSDPLQARRRCLEHNVCTLAGDDDVPACVYCVQLCDPKPASPDGPPDLNALLGSMGQRHGNVATWAVGVTTAPREASTLSRCLHSLMGAGWPAGLVFAEPGDYYAHERWPLVQRYRQSGVLANFLLGLLELYLRDSNADAYLMVQDDAMFVPGCRQYLEEHLWPEDADLVVSLFDVCATQDRRGWRTDRTNIWAPIAFLMPNRTVRRLLSSLGPIFDYRQHHGELAIGNLAEDLAYNHWFIDNGINTWFPSPSLVHHDGRLSSIWDGGLLDRNRAGQYVAGRRANADVSVAFVSSNAASLVPANLEQPGDWRWLVRGEERPTTHPRVVHIPAQGSVECWLAANRTTRWVAMVEVEAGVQLPNNWINELLDQLDYTQETIVFRSGLEEAAGSAKHARSETALVCHMTDDKRVRRPSQRRFAALPVPQWYRQVKTTPSHQRAAVADQAALSRFNVPTP